MPGLCYQNQNPNIRCGYRNVCECQNCPCKNYINRRLQKYENGIPPNAIVFQLPKFRDAKPDTYSHTVYAKEYCNRTLMKQHAVLAQKKASQRPKIPPPLQQERFANKTTTATDYRRYNCKETAASKATFPRIKRKEDFYFRPSEYSCTAKFPQTSMSHEDYCPKVRIPPAYAILKDCDLPPFEGMSCYKRDYNVPPIEAYTRSRVPRKRTIFN